MLIRVCAGCAAAVERAALDAAGVHPGALHVFDELTHADALALVPSPLSWLDIREVERLSVSSRHLSRQVGRWRCEAPSPRGPIAIRLGGRHGDRLW